MRVNNGINHDLLAQFLPDAWQFICQTSYTRAETGNWRIAASLLANASAPAKVAAAGGSNDYLDW